jgi:hypothetical protein
MWPNGRFNGAALDASDCKRNVSVFQHENLCAFSLVAGLVLKAA